ncbi:conserved Plasmodium protein, unknown function [Plasmodium gallinaceum]|uniref:Uncharacterized protein n=1 Tax=Plasmodium gallinaceum TaxID=5849 RepID=A0A1J1GVS3_PLAGA|nr:conserved Plasmodium protein, unknown function [Plasmodium gallinaceum]CRG95386.1 conserved Plasmodium protein, unknown function [Plasmodium gallinaceum]
MRNKNMNLNIIIKASFPRLNSEKKKKKKNAKISSKPKSEKENSDKKKIKNIKKKENFLSNKLIISTSLLSYDKRKNIKLFNDSFNKKKVTSKKSFPEKDKYRKIYTKRQFSNKSNNLNKFSAKSILNINIPKNSKKKNIGNILGSKLIKSSIKIVDTTNKKRNFSSNLQKNTQKKNKYISSDLKIILNKRNYKLKKGVAQLEKPLKKKKNKIKNFITLKKNLNTMEDKENQGDNSHNGNEKKEVDDQIELKEDKEMNIKNDKEVKDTKDQEMNMKKDEKMDTIKNEKMDTIKNEKMNTTKDEKMNTTKNEKMDTTKDQETNVEKNKNVIAQDVEKNNKEKKEKLIQDKISKNYALNYSNSCIHKSENLEYYFSEGTYEPSNDIFNENYQKVTNTLLPGYTITACEDIYQVNKDDTISDIRDLKKSGEYIYKSYFPTHKFIPHLNNNPVKEAYYLRNHEVLYNYLYTSSDLTRGSLHEQSNMVVAYPYGVPFIDIKKK